MKTKRTHEGYLMLDHRAAPGIPEDAAQAAGMPPFSNRGLFEAPTYTCSHCQTVVIVNPLRNRERAYCRKCDHYICDSCGSALAQTQVCRPFKQILDELQEQAVQEQQSSGIIVAK